MIGIQVNILPNVSIAQFRPAPELPTVALEGTTAMLTQSQASALHSLSFLSFTPLVAKKREGGRPDAVVVILGEQHSQPSEDAKIGEGFVKAFSRRALELDDTGPYVHCDALCSIDGLDKINNCPSTMSAALLHGVCFQNEQDEDFFYEMVQKALSRLPSLIPPGSNDDFVFELTLRGACYSRKIYLSPEDAAKILRGERINQVFKSGSNFIIENDSPVRGAYDYDELRNIYNMAFGIVPIGLGLAIRSFLNGADHLMAMDLIIGFAPFIAWLVSSLNLDENIAARDRFMAARVAEEIERSADDQATLLICGSAHVQGITDNLVKDHGFFMVPHS